LFLHEKNLMLGRLKANLRGRLIMKVKWKGGFTLVELLVVISIIALLMSIMIPALRKAKSQARNLICSTNMHNWGIAISAYAAGNDGFFPSNGKDPIRNSFDFCWVSGTMSQFFEDYLFKLDKSAAKAGVNILFCPTDKYHRERFREKFGGHDLQYYIDNGLVGYNVLFGNDEDLLSLGGSNNYKPPSCPNGLNWVTRKKLGSKYNRGPILEDNLQSIGYDLWQDGGVPFASHASPRDDIPEGGNFLFEDGSVRWYKGIDNVIDSFHGGEIGIGAYQRSWIIYYGLLDVR
jgi:prepilin-type N-terminal cleavage/methylation domain-containing protein